MNSSTGRRLSDSDLRLAILDYANPLEIEGYTDERPDRDFAPMILGEYHLPAESEVRCSLCEQRQKHQNGFVVEFAPGRRHLIGGDCGRRELGAEFGRAKSRHNDERSRQRYLRRLDALVVMKDHIIEYCDTVLQGEDRKQLAATNRVLEAVAGNSMVRLRSLLGRGGLLAEDVRVRDREAEKKRDAALPEGAEARPIYTTTTVQLGPLLGQRSRQPRHRRLEHPEVAADFGASGRRGALCRKRHQQAAFGCILLSVRQPRAATKMVRVSLPRRADNEGPSPCGWWSCYPAPEEGKSTRIAQHPVS